MSELLKACIVKTGFYILSNNLKLKLGKKSGYITKIFIRSPDIKIVSNIKNNQKRRNILNT